MRKSSCRWGIVLGFVGLVLSQGQASADIIRVNQAAFLPAAGVITFSEFAVGTVNPTYLPGNYGGGAGAPTVTFDGFFTGQSLGTVATCPPGANVNGCVVGTPSNPLTLNAAAPDTRIANDGANPTSPVLSGTPQFNGAIGILFSTDQAAVGLTGGFFDNPSSTSIRAYSRTGALLGSVTNTGTGLEFLGLATSDGTAQIAGLLFSLVGAEAAGFAIDNVRFGVAGQVTVPAPIPEPASLMLLGSGLLTLAARRRRQRALR